MVPASHRFPVGPRNFADQVSGRDPRLHQTIRIPGYLYLVLTTNRAMYCDMDCSLTGYSLNKFVMRADNLVMGNVRGSSYNDLPVIRLAEVYLTFGGQGGARHPHSDGSRPQCEPYPRPRRYAQPEYGSRQRQSRPLSHIRVNRIS